MSVGSYHKLSRGEGMITLRAKQADLQEYAEFAKLVPKAARAAQRRAINKTLRWLRTHVARSVAHQERIAVAAVRNRLRAYPIDGSGRGKLWFGINALDASSTGRARQTKSGVSVGGRRFRGAFYKKVYGSHENIWIRTASKQFNPADYPETSLGRQGLKGEINGMRSRFPLAKAKVALADVRPHFNAWVARADQRLLEILRHEMNYELGKHLRGINGG